MNDRFRFRAYYYNDVFNEWMIYENPEFITGDGTCRVFDNGESGADEWRENVILCQCTGLKDKNGKLIYEGDIIKEFYTDFVNFSRKDIKVVEWNNLNASYNFENLQNCEREVIGNIYENPELLED